MKHLGVCRLVGLAALIGLWSGCASLPHPRTAESPMAPVTAAGSRFFDGRTGAPLNWAAVVARLNRADIILVGEQHDNVIGHRIEAELADALLHHSPRAAVALEMFERHEQGLVDAYLDGRIAATTLVSLTESENWGGGKNTWMEWYQPIVDHVKARRASGASVVAANAPRTYAKLARLEGFAALGSLPREERAWFALPDLTVDDRAYRERFLATMRGHSTPAPTPTSAAANAPASTPKPAPAMVGRPEDFLRAQQVWDATLADSVLRTHRRHPKVMLFVGEFHVGFEGGTLARIRHRAPNARLATLSILRSDTPEVFANDDRQRADIVAYTNNTSAQPAP